MLMKNIKKLVIRLVARLRKSLQVIFLIWTFTGWDLGEHLVALKCMKENKINCLVRCDKIREDKCALKVQCAETGIFRDTQMRDCRLKYSPVHPSHSRTEGLSGLSSPCIRQCKSATALISLLATLKYMSEMDCMLLFLFCFCMCV